MDSIAMTADVCLVLYSACVIVCTVIIVRRNRRRLRVFDEVLIDYLLTRRGIATSEPALEIVRLLKDVEDRDVLNRLQLRATFHDRTLEQEHRALLDEATRPHPAWSQRLDLKRVLLRTFRAWKDERSKSIAVDSSQKSLPPLPEITNAEPTPVRVARLFGGASVLGHHLESNWDAHELLVEGLPIEAIDHLVAHLLVLERASWFTALGLSPRTLERRRRSPRKLVSRDQSARAWRFATVLVKATDVLGSQEAAERWLDQPARGLDQRRPIDLMRTGEGARLVEDLLGRLEHGVYT